jgi:hypothetical protein
MRAFAEIERELGLKHFLASPLGTLYFVPYAPGGPRVIVRRFDGQLPPVFAGPYADLIRAAQEWVEGRPELERLIRIERPTEVGADFVARPHHTYYTSIDAYTEWDDPPKRPPELKRMRQALRAALAQPADEGEEILGRVLARSLLEPTGKTYFHEGEGRFIVVEPKLTREDVERWAALSEPVAAGPAD